MGKNVLIKFQVVKTPPEELQPIAQQSFYGSSKEYVASPLLKSGSEDLVNLFSVYLSYFLRF